MQVAAACSLQMHALLREELMAVVAPTESGPDEGGEGKKEKWREVMNTAFRKMDQLAMAICICGREIAECGGCRHIELVHAGSTALVAVLTPEHIVVANCGNSRAVLCRDGRAISLSRDHKVDSHCHIFVFHDYTAVLQGKQALVDSALANFPGGEQEDLLLNGL